jgi:hypothetical protein
VFLVLPLTKDLPGLSTLIVAEASDNLGGSGIDEVQFYYNDSGGGPPVLIGTDTTIPYSVVWTFPSCSESRNDNFRIFARAFDRCGNSRDSARMNVRLRGRGCSQAESTTGADLRLATDLAVVGGQGQIVLDGSEASFPAFGRSEIVAAVRPGLHRVEAVLVVGRGEPGRWRFELASGARPGSLRVIAGDVDLVTADAVVFRLKGRAGERVVFAFATDEPR